MDLVELRSFRKFQALMGRFGYKIERPRKHRDGGLDTLSGCLRGLSLCEKISPLLFHRVEEQWSIALILTVLLVP